MDILEEIYNLKVVSVSPVFDRENVLGGYFDVAFSNDYKHKLPFAWLINYLLEQDKKLFEYTKSRYIDSSKTLSDIIEDYQSLGIDLPSSVEQYYKDLVQSIDPNAIKSLYKLLSKLMDGSDADFDDEEN